MELWLVRAGQIGEYEDKFLNEGRIYLTWNGLSADLGAVASREALLELLKETYPDGRVSRLSNHATQIWSFSNGMDAGDWVVLPSKKQPVIHIGKIAGPYTYQAEGPDPFFHYRQIEWIGKEVPRANFGQDLLYSFGAFTTICRIQRNNALQRVQAMAANGWQAESTVALLKHAAKVPAASQAAAEGEVGTDFDLVQVAREQVVRLIDSRFKGHALTSLIAAILQAQGYTVWQSPEGADGGADILASNGGTMGFGAERICIEVKSGSGMTDRPTVDKLLGAMTKFNANYGLFVAWGGFKPNVQKELASSFFKLRLWTQDDVLNALFAVYDDLDEEIKAALPLQRTWTVVQSEN